MGWTKLGRLVLGALLMTVTPLLAAEDEESPEAIGGVVRYVELKPTFVTNFGISQSGRLKYVKADVTVRVTSKEGEYAARLHAPQLRNSMVMLLSRQDESTVASADGRQTIKAEALSELRDILQEEVGEPFIEDLMFTNFVVQR
ncbi:MAG: flagellar basal body-associated FliL family protein [Pseudomonadota bacterium]